MLLLGIGSTNVPVISSVTSFCQRFRPRSWYKNYHVLLKTNFLFIFFVLRFTKADYNLPWYQFFFLGKRAVQSADDQRYVIAQPYLYNKITIKKRNYLLTIQYVLVSQ